MIDLRCWTKQRVLFLKKKRKNCTSSVVKKESHWFLLVTDQVCWSTIICYWNWMQIISGRVKLLNGDIDNVLLLLIVYSSSSTLESNRCFIWIVITITCWWCLPWCRVGIPSVWCPPAWSEHVHSENRVVLPTATCYNLLQHSYQLNQILQSFEAKILYFFQHLDSKLCDSSWRIVELLGKLFVQYRYLLFYRVDGFFEFLPCKLIKFGQLIFSYNDRFVSCLSNLFSMLVNHFPESCIVTVPVVYVWVITISDDPSHIPCNSYCSSLLAVSETKPAYISMKTDNGRTSFFFADAFAILSLSLFFLAFFSSLPKGCASSCWTLASLCRMSWSAFKCDTS